MLTTDIVSNVYTKICAIWLAICSLKMILHTGHRNSVTQGTPHIISKKNHINLRVQTFKDYMFNMREYIYKHQRKHFQINPMINILESTIMGYTVTWDTVSCVTL